MTSTLLIVFREALEMALVISIVLAATRELAASRRWIAAGAGAGLAGAIVVAGLAGVISDAVSGMGQELFQASVLLLAAGLLAWTVIWMQSHGRELSAHLHNVSQSVTEGEKPRTVLAVVVGLAVLREGSEVVLFLNGVVAAGQTDSILMLTGGVLGLCLAGGLSVLAYAGLIRIPHKHLFSVTSWLLTLLAAGMTAQAAHYLVMVDMLPALGQPLWDSSRLLPESGVIGQLLHVLMGYDDRPSGMQVIAFAAMLLIVMILNKRTNGASGRSAKTSAGIILAGALMLGQVGMAEARKVYSPIVNQGEIELEYQLDSAVDGDPAVDGTAKHQFELGYGVTDRWSSGVYAVYTDTPVQGFKYERFKWENIYQLFEQGERWLDAGLYAEYQIPADSVNKPDILEFKILLEKQTAGLLHTANLIFGEELGVNATKNTTFGYAWRSKWRMMREFEQSFEIYGSIGEISNADSLSRQSHILGPVISGRLIRQIEYEVGYLFALTKGAANGNLKLVLACEF